MPAETCNGVDDDCDGTVDEGLFAPCDAPRGICAGGVSVVNIDNGFGAAVVASLINRGPAALREANK